MRIVGKGMQREGFDACSIPLLVVTIAISGASSQDGGILLGLRTEREWEYTINKYFLQHGSALHDKTM